MLGLPRKMRDIIRSQCSLAARARLDACCKQLRAEEPLWFYMTWWEAKHARDNTCFAVIWHMGGARQLIWQAESLHGRYLVYFIFGGTLQVMRPTLPGKPWRLRGRDNTKLAEAATLEDLVVTPAWLEREARGELGPTRKAGRTVTAL